MADTASLIIRVVTDGVSSVSSELEELASLAKEAATAVGLVVSVGASLNKLINVSRQMSVLTSGLKTMTGSAESAALAFQELQKFAAQTPYTLDQAVEGFTKLTALGLEPSKKALESYGNTAAAMGKDLSQMIEAVADAATGEFERLKEFGIKTKQQGDQVSFTFQGVTTTVGKNAAEIEGYLQSLGENQFAGAMANRMETLDGALSNLQDSWDGLFRAISSEGSGEIIEDQVRLATSALEELSAMIASGEMTALIGAWGDQWQSTFNEIGSGLTQLDTFLTDTLNGWGMTASSTSNFMSDAFWEFPANMRALVQIAVTEVAGFVDKAKAYGQAAAEALNPLSDGAWRAQLQLDLAAIDHNVNTLSASYLAQRDASVGAMDAQIAKSKELRTEFDKQKKPFDLGQFQMGGSAGGTTGGQSAADKRRTDAAAKRMQAEQEQAKTFLDTLARQNADELAAIDEVERQKLAKLQEFQMQGAISTQQAEDAKTQIMVAAEDARQEELARRRRDTKQRQFEHDQVIAEIQSLNASELELVDIQAQQKAAITKRYYEEGIISEREYQAALGEIAAEANERRRDEYASILGQTTDDLKTALGEGNKVYKAFAVANAIMDTYSAATAAYKSTAAIPIVGPYLAPIAAGAAIGAGMANVAKIRSAREQGGNLAAGQMSTIAERGLPEVIMPASASRVRTARQMKQIMGESSASSQPTTVQIVNQTSGRIDSATTERMDEATLRVIIRETVSGDLQDSNSPIAKSRRATRGQAGY